MEKKGGQKWKTELKEMKPNNPATTRPHSRKERPVDTQGNARVSKRGVLPWPPRLQDTYRDITAHLRIIFAWREGRKAERNSIYATRIRGHLGYEGAGEESKEDEGGGGRLRS